MYVYIYIHTRTLTQKQSWIHYFEKKQCSSYRNPVGVLLADFLAFRFPLLENVVFFILEFHCADTKKMDVIKTAEKLDSNDVRRLQNKRKDRRPFKRNSHNDNIH